MTSALGYPLSELVLRRLGRRGVVVVETVCAGLLVRDLTLIRSGAPGRLRRLPAHRRPGTRQTVTRSSIRG